MDEWYHTKSNDMLWYNYDTKQYDSGPADETNADAMRPYVPDILAARNFYQLLIDVGNNPTRAAGYVHESVLGIPHSIEIVGV